MFISIEILLLVLYGSVTLNFNLPSCEDKKFLVLLTCGNMEHDLRFNDLLIHCVKVHQQAALDNIAEKQKMENELIMRVFSLMWICIRNLRSCGDLENYIDLDIPSAKKIYKAPHFMRLLYVLIPSYQGVLQAGDKTLDHFTSTGMSFACRSSWFSSSYIQHLLLTRWGFRHVEETQLVRFDISSDTGILSYIFAVLDS